MADGFCTGGTAGVDCGIAVGSQPGFSPKTGPQVVLQPRSVAHEWPCVGNKHSLVAQNAPQVVLQAELVLQNSSKLAAPFWSAGQFSAEETPTVDASIIAAAKTVYFLNMLVHLRSITIVFQIVHKS